jgi:adenylate kinase
MTGRRVCPKCGASYHIVANPPKMEGICNQCGSELAIRKDDAPETVRKRLEVYHATTEVLKEFYGKLGRLCLVEGNQPIENANEEILKAIGAQG